VNQAQDARLLERRLYVGLAVLLAALWLAGLGARPLFNPDEGRYAEIPREMLAGRDWVIPHLNGLEYLEKPPLQYWATALSYRWFGVNEFAARLYGALCAFGTIALCWVMARRLGGVACAWRAAAMLSGMLIFCVLGHLLTLDMSLTFYLTATLAGFLLAQTGGPPTGGAPNTSRYWMLLAWVAAALGVMTKGMVAAAIPAAVLVAYSLWTRDFSAWRGLQLPLGLALFLAIAVPWHWLAARRDADFLEFYFVHEHLARYLTPVAQRVQPWWFFLAVFVAGTAPWSLSAVRVVAAGWRRASGPRREGADFDAPLFLWIWVVFIIVFFSLSDSKLMPYILPVMPAVAVAAALSPLVVLRREYLVTAIFTLIVGVGLGVASSMWPRIMASSDRADYFMPLGKTAAKVAALLIVTGVIVVALRRRNETRACVLLGTGWCLAWMCVGVDAKSIAPVYSGVGLARAILADERGAAVQGARMHAAPLYSVATYDQTLEFYLERNSTLVQYRGELDYGLHKTPGVEIADIKEFERRWMGDSTGFAIMEFPTFERLRGDGLPMRVIGRSVGELVAARQ
jgi:4-amino-4-deoxy-L-arabinose transferase-like glycosyltransferase